MELLFNVVVVDCISCMYLMVYFCLGLQRVEKKLLTLTISGKFTRSLSLLFSLSSTSTLLSILSVLAVQRPFYISICISTLPTQHTTFIILLSVYHHYNCHHNCHHSHFHSHCHSYSHI